MNMRARPHQAEETAAEPERDGSELPEGWATGSLDSIAELNPRHPIRLDDAQLVTFVPMPSMNESNPDFDRGQERPLAEVRKGYTHFADGDVLFAKITPCMENGKGAVATDLKNGLGCGTTELHVIRPLGGMNPHYIYRFLQQESVRRDAAANFTGSAGQLRVPLSFIAQLELPIPPLAEQRRIVGKLELLLGKVSSSQQRLSRVPGLLKRFRQSVLAAACSGKLTADWRAENEDLEPASALIAETRFQLSEDVVSLLELPPSWEWTPLGNYARCSRGRFLVRPRNDPSCFGGPYPFIQIGNLPPYGGCITSHTQTLNEKGLRVSKMFPKGTVAIAIVGATIGNSGFLGYDMCFTDSMVGLETGSEAGNRYIEFFLRHRKNDIREASYAGGGQPNIKLDTLNPYPLALPPLSEQQEIVRRVEKLFAFADQIEARLKQAQAHVDRLTQSLLAKAFRGELVPQDPTDEPASALLARIRAATTPAKPARRRT